MNPSSPELVGLLRRQVRARVLNLSVSGCLIETTARLEVGSACELRVVCAEETLVDDIRVTRCVEVQGAGSTYRVGAQFLWTTMPAPHSLRRLAVSVRRKQVGGGDTVVGPEAPQEISPCGEMPGPASATGLEANSDGAHGENASSFVPTSDLTTVTFARVNPEQTAASVKSTTVPGVVPGANDT